MRGGDTWWCVELFCQEEMIFCPSSEKREREIVNSPWSVCLPDDDCVPTALPIEAIQANQLKTSPEYTIAATP